MVLTTALLVVSTFAVPVEIGTSLPTIRVATWLSMTTIEGLDSTLVVVTACKASRIKFGAASDPIRKLKPGNARLSAAPTRPAAFVDAHPGVEVGMLDMEPGTPPAWLWRKYCTP